MTITQIGIPQSNYMKGRTWKGISYTPQVIVLHWMAGTLRSTDKTFQNPRRGASAHFGIADGGSVHQYVSVQDTAYHCGNWWVNLKSIGIEHEGAPGIPITDATYNSSASLLAVLCKQFGIEPSERTFVPHKQVMPTQCPGTLDIPRLISMVRQIMHTTPVDHPLNVPEATGEVVSSTVRPFVAQVTAKGGLRVRVRPDHNSDDVPSKFLRYGDKLTIRGVVQGTDPYGDGRNLWLHTYVSGYYIWASGTNITNTNATA